MTRRELNILLAIATLLIVSALAFVYEVACMEDHSKEPTMEEHP